VKPLKELKTILLGVVAILIFVSFGWLLFHGIYRLGSNMQSLLHWHIMSECADGDDEFICMASTWVVGFASLMVIPTLWCAGTIFRWVMRKLR
jgi:hypothetical protein